MYGDLNEIDKEKDKCALLALDNLRQCIQIMSMATPSGQPAGSCGPAKLTSLQILPPAGASEPPAHTVSHNTYKRVLNFDSSIIRVPPNKCLGSSLACHHSVSRSR
ncbi:hypothetical protein O3P69_002986 [Scylla paramamosain]|uniref:Uncharacterized protein n=1 Tax=Scylla paramamosain TaxID=85552 RepID=A0AAW0UL94_SCYPA